MTTRNMHIAMVVRSFSPHGGLELYTHRLVEGLLRTGLRVTVICEESSTALTDTNLRIVRFPPAKPGMRKSQRLEHYYGAASNAVEDHGPFDLVHSQQLPVAAADVVTFHNHTLRRMSEVGTTWENLFNRLKRSTIPAYRLRDRFDRELCSSARCLMFPSQRCRDDYYQTFGSNGELSGTPSVVAFPGADPVVAGTSEQRNANQHPDASPMTFLFVGKGYRTKGLNILLEALSILNSRNRDFRLLVAGMRLRPVQQVQLALAGLEERVSYLGYLDDLNPCFRQSSAFVMPSRMETFGMACLQAMQHGLVPIVSRVTGVSEILDNGKNALIQENHLDAHELAALMERLIDDRELLAKLRLSAAELAARTTWESTVAATLHAYELASSSSRTTPTADGTGTAPASGKRGHSDS